MGETLLRYINPPEGATQRWDAHSFADSTPPNAAKSCAESDLTEPSGTSATALPGVRSRGGVPGKSRWRGCGVFLGALRAHVLENSQTQRGFANLRDHFAFANRLRKTRPKIAPIPSVTCSNGR